MRKVLSLVLCLMMIISCIPAMAEEAPVKTGLSVITTVAQGRSGGTQANIALAAVTVDDNGVIDACVLDYVQAPILFDETGKITTDLATEFQSKNELGDAYNMRPASSINAEWNEQAAAFAAYCVGKTIEEIKGMAVTEDGKPADADLAASMTLEVAEFLPSVEDAVAKATHRGARKGDVLKLTQVTTMNKSKDATADAAGQTQAYAHLAAITLSGDVISSCIIDAVQANASFDAAGKITSELNVPVQSKLALGDAYGMRPASKIGKEWFEQAEGFCAFVTGKTIAEALGVAVNESGYPADADLAATTTMNISSMLKLIEKAGK